MERLALARKFKNYTFILPNGLMEQIQAISYKAAKGVILFKYDFTIEVKPFITTA